MTEPSPLTKNASFRDLTWRTKWLFAGGAFLALWNSTRFIDREWFASWPAWLVLVATGMVPQLFLLLFPLLSRDKKDGNRIEVPALKHCLIESAIALPIVVVTLVAIGILNYLVGVLSPGKTLTPDAITGMASSSSKFTYLILLFSFTFAPFAEEVFFRGFVYNALRRRLPIIIAGLLQSLIFGFCHFFGTTHAVVAVAIGLLVTAVYEWRKTLVTPVFVHAGINFVSAIGVLAMMAEFAERPALGVIKDPNDVECVVRKVVPQSAAYESGIAINDKIIAVDEFPIANFSELSAVIAAKKPGDLVSVRLIREGETIDIDVVLKRNADTSWSP